VETEARLADRPLGMPWRELEQLTWKRNVPTKSHPNSQHHVNMTCARFSTERMGDTPRMLHTSGARGHSQAQRYNMTLGMAVTGMVRAEEIGRRGGRHLRRAKGTATTTMPAMATRQAPHLYMPHTTVSSIEAARSQQTHGQHRHGERTRTARTRTMRRGTGWEARRRAT
jgi:hypothetical protein